MRTTQTLQQENAAELAKQLAKQDRRAHSQVNWKATPIGKHGPDDLMQETAGEWDPRSGEGQEILRLEKSAREETENAYARVMHRAGRLYGRDAAEEPEWEKFIAPTADAREWLRDLAVKVDANRLSARHIWARLRDHVLSQPSSALVRDLDEKLVGKCLEILCKEETNE